MSELDDDAAMEQALAEARRGMDAGHGGPFGAVVVREGELIASAHNEVLLRRDPTAHAEVLAIRSACERLGSFSLAGCTLYASCEPCPMCLGAALWARVDAVVHAGSREDAAAVGFDDAAFYRAFRTHLPPLDDGGPEARPLVVRRVAAERGAETLRRWLAKPDRQAY